MPHRSTFPCRIVLLALLALLASCANTPESQANNDPLEPLNRHTLDNNYFFDRLLMRPLAELYRVTIPPGIRTRVADILSNMREPVILANNLLQGRFDRAGTTIERFGINTTLGVGGMWDVAGAWDLHQQTGDFGQTLASWGVDEGPYLMLPFFGPSNVRDAVGRGVDMILSPWQYLTLLRGTTALVRYETAYFGTDLLVRREHSIESIDAMRAGSIDFYATLRSAYRQYRAKQLEQPSEEPPPSLDDGDQ